MWFYLNSVGEKLYYKFYPLLWADHVKLQDQMILFLQLIVSNEPQLLMISLFPSMHFVKMFTSSITCHITNQM